jgi:hypothetical protein
LKSTIHNNSESSVKTGGGKHGRINKKQGLALEEMCLPSSRQDFEWRQAVMTFSSEVKPWEQECGI